MPVTFSREAGAALQPGGRRCRLSALTLAVREEAPPVRPHTLRVRDLDLDWDEVWGRGLDRDSDEDRAARPRGSGSPQAARVGDTIATAASRRRPSPSDGVAARLAPPSPFQVS